MTFWQRWLRQPQSVFLRKALFQVHLWTGLALGLYIVMLSLTGSALVFRRELDAYFTTPRPPFDEAARVMSKEEISEKALRVYPGYTITYVSERPTRRSNAILVSLERGDDKKERLFNPYTGEELGDSFPPASRAILWVVSLHDELLMPQEGRFWNGVGSILTTLLCVTGLIIWWPGIRNWRRGMGVKWKAAWPRLNFDLHSATGFWFFSIVFIWAVSGIYLAMPGPFTETIDYFSGPNGEGRIGRAMDITMLWLTRLHFGRWRSHTLKVVWVIIGLVPAVLFVTGAVMWWQRVIRKRNLLG